VKNVRMPDLFGGNERDMSINSKEEVELAEEERYSVAPGRIRGASSYSDRLDSFLLLLGPSGLRRRLSAIIMAAAIQIACISG